MINHRRKPFTALVIGLMAFGSLAPALAQTGGAGTAGTTPAAPVAPGQAGKPAASGTAGATGTAPAPVPAGPGGAPGGTPGPLAIPPPDEVPPGEALGDEQTPKTNVEAPLAAPTAHGASTVPLVFPSSGVTRKKRLKPLRTTVGLDPTAPDLGGEADLVSVLNEGSANVKPKRWTFTMHGHLRAPLTVGIGPGNLVASRPATYMIPDYELHSPATHVVGRSPDDWRSVGLTPAPIGSLYFSVGNALISGTVIVSAQTFYDVGYKKLNDMGTISQAYLTMKFNDAFGYRGGLALTAGAFSNRYGLAGPKQQSGGYYNTYLFGRTRVAGINATADIDIDDHKELVIEAGVGAKIEVVPWLYNPAGPAPYLPEQGPTPQGSNFVWQFHPALFIDEWFKVAAHYMTSYTPNDNWGTGANNAASSPPASSRMHVLGADVHVDRPRMGSLYLGYSHVDAKAVLSLADGIQLLHSPNGFALTSNFLNPGYAPPPLLGGGVLTTAPVPGTVGDNGKIDTVLFQYMVRLAPLLELPATGRDLTLALYGMFNHVTSASIGGGKQDKIKFGAEAQYAFWRYLSAGVRFDRVMPDGGNADVAYTAISPRVVLHTSWISREYILLSYTRYFLGSSYGAFMDPPPPPGVMNPIYQYDKNLLVLSAQIAF
jgi:hypothetical protein